MHPGLQDVLCVLLDEDDEKHVYICTGDNEHQMCHGDNVTRDDDTGEGISREPGVHPFCMKVQLHIESSQPIKHGSVVCIFFWAVSFSSALSHLDSTFLVFFLRFDV